MLGTSGRERAGVRQWLGLAALLLPTMLMTADLGVLWLATPYLTADLRPSGTELLWITDVYGFMTAGFLLVMGTLGDRVGRRRLLMVGAVLFLVASLAAAYAPNAAVLIAARAVLGIAGAAVLPSTLGLISHLFADARQRATATAMWVTALSVGLGVGPLVGGLLLVHFWWGSVFLIGVPVMVLALVSAPLLLPEYRDPSAGRLDKLSVALFLLGVLPLVYAVKQVAVHGFGPQVAVTALLGVAFTVAFVRRQRRLADPLLDLRLFGRRTFAAALIVLLVGMLALNGVGFLIPQFLQLVGGLSPVAASLWLLPGAAGLIAGSQLTPLLARRFAPAYVLAGGLLVMVVGFLAIVGASATPAGIAFAVVGNALTLFGVAPISVLCTGMAVASAPEEKAGAAAASGQTAYDLGLALGIAVTGTIATAVYRSTLAGSLPAGLPAGVRDTAIESLGGALATSSSEVVAIGRAAFTSGLHTAAIVSAVLAVGLAVLVTTLLKSPSKPRTSAVAGASNTGEQMPRVVPGIRTDAVLVGPKIDNLVESSVLSKESSDPGGVPAS
jgi:DHA2 family multidrug resistance protein-like MFS transporter